MTPAGFIAYDDEVHAVIGAGTTAEEARAEAEHADPTAAVVVLPATAALIADFRETGDPTWLTVDVGGLEVACLEEERDAH